MKKLAVFACLLLAGCDKPLAVQVKQEPSATEPAPPVARWAIVPVPNSTTIHESQGQIFSYVWRLDTVTGTLDMCSYAESPGNLVRDKFVELTSLTCNYSAKAYPSP